MTNPTQGHLQFRRWVDALESQQAVADAIGCSQANVSEIYRGRRLPTTPLQARIRDESARPVGDRWEGQAIPLDAWAEPVETEIHDGSSADVGDVVTPRNVKRVATAGQCR